MNISSDVIQIYPAANRNPINDPLARLNIEQNLIKVNNNITNYNSYVVLNNTPIARNESTFTLQSGDYVIDGYNINIIDNTQSIELQSPSTNTYSIYLELEFENKTFTVGSQSRQISELKSADKLNNPNVIDGVTFNITTGSVPTQHTLLLATINYNGSWGDLDFHTSQARVNTNKTRVNVNSDGNFNGLLSDTTARDMYFEEFLKNMIIDDGELQ